MRHPSTVNLLPSYDDVMLPDVPIIQTQNLTKKNMVVLSEYVTNNKRKAKKRQQQACKHEKNRKGSGRNASNSKNSKNKYSLSNKSSTKPIVRASAPVYHHQQVRIIISMALQMQ